MTISSFHASIAGRSALPRESGPVAPGPRPATDPADEVWVAGFEIGRLDAQLAARPYRAKVGLTIRAVNGDAAEVLARRHGYELHVRGASEDGFVWVEFWPRH